MNRVNIEVAGVVPDELELIVVGHFIVKQLNRKWSKNLNRVNIEAADMHPDEVELISEHSTEAFMKDFEEFKIKSCQMFDCEVRQRLDLEETLRKEKAHRLRLQEELQKAKENNDLKDKLKDELQQCKQHVNRLQDELNLKELQVSDLNKQCHRLRKDAKKLKLLATIFNDDSDVSDALDVSADSKRPNEFDAFSIQDESNPSSKRLKTANTCPLDPNISETSDFGKKEETPTCKDPDSKVEFESVERNPGVADKNLSSIDNVKSDRPADVSNNLNFVTNEELIKERCCPLGSNDDLAAVRHESPIANMPRNSRRNIKKVMEYEDLSSKTKQIYQQEEERKKRSARRLKKYKESYGTLPGEPDNMDEILLDFDPKTKDELLTVDPQLSTKLKPHQCDGVIFMWNSCFESIDRLRFSKGSGCILNHCTGLGKKLQVIALAHTLLTNRATTKVSKVLIICPKNVISNWVDEFDIWLKSFPKKQRIDVFQLVSSNPDKRAKVLKSWESMGDVLIIGYEMFGLMYEEMGEKSFETLIDPGADLVVCDEGHLLKNATSQVSRAVYRIRTQRRIVLTGTPLQNNLTECFAMVEFVKPRLLGTEDEFNNRFVEPIINGEFIDSTAEDIALMKKQADVLHKLLDGCVHRRDYSVLAELLPAKEEHMLFIRLTITQMHLYKWYMTNGIVSKTKPVTHLPPLQRICNHPMVLANFQNRPKSRQLTFDKKDKNSEAVPGENVPNKLMDWWKPICSDDQALELSNKMLILATILSECEMRNEKLVVFSGCVSTLNVIEHFLSKLSEATRNLKASSTDYGGLWIRDLDYSRLDGDENAKKRNRDVTRFNLEDNARTRLFLISTKARSWGIDLIAASRVVIFDASWNYSDDIQSIFRVYRIGQMKKCFIYRFVALGTMEEKIYDRQVDKHQIGCNYCEEDLKQLYSIDDLDPPTRNHPCTPTGDDDLLHAIFKKYDDVVYKHRDHDCLLGKV